MKTYSFHLLWPGGNTTALVRSLVDRKNQPRIARLIMQAYPDVEQVGFLEPLHNRRASIRLQMMGGEFCGNAARAAGFLWTHERQQSTADVMLEVSGLSDPVMVRVEGDQVSVSLSRSFFCGMHRVPEGSLVDLKGIRHLVVEAAVPPAEVRRLVDHYRGDFLAVGIITLQRQGQTITITPQVWVRATDTCVAESACGSGSIAAAIAVATPGASETIAVKQPSGEVYRVDLASAGDGFSSIKFSGIVKVLGSYSINEPAGQ